MSKMLNEAGKFFSYGLVTTGVGVVAGAILLYMGIVESEAPYIVRSWAKNKLAEGKRLKADIDHYGGGTIEIVEEDEV